jgi:hypothetical protein
MASVSPVSHHVGLSRLADLWLLVHQPTDLVGGQHVAPKVESLERLDHDLVIAPDPQERSDVGFERPVAIGRESPEISEERGKARDRLLLPLPQLRSQDVHVEGHPARPQGLDDHTVVRRVQDARLAC